MMPQFSVVMPVYNKASTLKASLACVYRQTRHDYELIAVDDGSTDGSLELLMQEEQQGRLRLLRRSVPGPGGYAARNLGAEQARGRWLVFFDADDLLLFDHLSRFADAIAAHPRIALFVNAYQKMEGHQRLTPVMFLQQGVMSRREALAVFARFDFIHMNGACIRRERFLDLGGFPAGRYRRGGDVYFWLKLLCSLEEIHYDNTVTSLWLLDHSGVTRNSANVGPLHPCLDVRQECEAALSRCERHYLRSAANRKVLSWAVEKKRLGQSVARDLGALSLDAMRLRHLYHVTSLMLPLRLFERLRGLAR